MNKHNTSRRINILRDSVARRIAAGEVIDRPQAVVRELLDNAIDAGATEINLYISGGGIDEIRVTDNGSGMDRQNLQKCFLPHATSKINDFEDIYSTKSLGFRGEALSSIASCSKLMIISAETEDGGAHRLEVNDGKLRSLDPYQGSKGSLISVRDLFYSMPGRKNFLKSASAESAQCRAVFLDKALPHTGISFRYFVDDKLKLFLPAADLKTRVQSAYGSLFHNNLLNTFSTESDGIIVKAAAGTPSLYRKDRKYIHIFINNRRVSDYSLVQAVDYAYSSYLPGGCHPVCFLFLDIPPENVDFNIHPAKREVKFRNLPAIHHTVTETLGSFLSRNNSFNASIKRPAAAEKTVQNDLDIGEVISDRPAASGYSQAAYSGKTFKPQDSIFRKEKLPDIAAELAPVIESTPEKDAHPGRPDQAQPEALIYLGQIFNLFLVFEHGSNLMLIDQHAAHERLIFNSLAEGNPEIQELLVPISFSVDKNREKTLLLFLEEYRKLGFDLQQAAAGEWLINSMPALCSGMEDEITAFFSDNVKNDRRA